MGKQGRKKREESEVEGGSEGRIKGSILNRPRDTATYALGEKLSQTLL